MTCPMPTVPPTRRSGFAVRCAALAIFLSLLAASAAPDPAGILDRWFAVQANVRTWTGDFVQTRWLAALNQPLTATGRVTVAIPDCFRWELGNPPQTIALRQTNSLYVIYPKLKRAEKYPLDAKQPGPWKDAMALLDAGFPRSRADLQAAFNLLSVAETNQVFCILLEPKSPLARRMMPQLQVELKKTDFDLSGLEMRFADGSRLRNDFSHTQPNAPLPAACFDPALDATYKITEPMKP